MTPGASARPVRCDRDEAANAGARDQKNESKRRHPRPASVPGLRRNDGRNPDRQYAPAANRRRSPPYLA
jgi:hypothetical protein